MRNNGSQMRRRRGFALAIVVVLLGLLVLATWGLAALVRTGGQVAVSNGSGMRARQNALLGLAIGLAELQKSAGPDERVTGMAGITGVPAGATRTTRHWCGVWRSDGRFEGWLVSGATNGGAAMLPTGIGAVTLVGDGGGGAGTVGASTAQSEHVIAGKVPIVTLDPSRSVAKPLTLGAYAFLIVDEGVKISAWSPPGDLAVPSLAPEIVADKPAQTRLHTALDQHAARLPRVLSYEQLAALPAPAAALTPSTLQDNFHHVTLTACAVAADGSGLRSGMVNLNTTSPYVWASILAAYNAGAAGTKVPNDEIVPRARTIADGFSMSGSGKLAGGPFTTVAAFGGSALLAQSLPENITPEEFMGALGALLAVRSDTFRIRAYGETPASNDASRIGSAAYCEAVVQRVPELASDGTSRRRFVIRSFRWMGPDDV